MLCFAESNLGEEGKKSTAQFEALEKGDDIPEKEPIKEATDIKKDPVVTVDPKSETINENDANKNNGNHTPV